MAAIDLAQYQGREQAYVKHCLLQNYLSPWSYKIASAWDSLVFVDGFAGPWGAIDEEFADSSFGIAHRVLSESIDGLQKKGTKVAGLCIFVEKAQEPFKKLSAFATKSSTSRVRAEALQGRFVKNIPKIEQLIRATGSNPFKFIFLDQKGWAAAPMADLKPFIADRSCEILFNLMTSFLTRFVEHEAKAESYNQLFGRPGVLEKIRALPKGTGEREQAAVQEYCTSLKQVCGFRYVCQAVILDPATDKVRYYLIFASNSPDGVKVFKDAEMKAARTQDNVRYESEVRKTGEQDLFVAVAGQNAPPKGVAHRLRALYSKEANRRVVNQLARSDRAFQIWYLDLFCEAMELPLVTPDDLLGFIQTLQRNGIVQLHLADKRRKPSTEDERDQVIVSNLEALKNMLATQ